MALACQMNSYLKELSTVVLTCAPSKEVLDIKNGDKTPTYSIILEDTVLFPDGGGQPDDRGTINGVPVIKVAREAASAVHYTQMPIEEGQQVQVKVDWSRRWDNMQQHSGQHLISALAESMFGYQTTSWWLGDETSYVELDTTALSVAQMMQLEDECNEKIRQCLPMTPVLYNGKDDPELPKEVSSRGLPVDHVGPVRVVSIEGVDANMCCGTHVSNLTHLQAIKLLAVEKGKKNRVNLTFVVGERVTRLLGQMYEREKALTGVLKGNPKDHVDLAEKMQKSLKETKKNELTLLRDIAKMEARLFLMSTPRKLYLSFHRKEGDLDFMRIISNEITDKNVVLFLTTGDDKGQGMFLVRGPQDLLADIVPKLMDLLQAKGAEKNGCCQGKANRLSKRGEVEKLVEQWVSTNQNQEL